MKKADVQWRINMKEIYNYSWRLSSMNLGLDFWI